MYLQNNSNEQIYEPCSERLDRYQYVCIYGTCDVKERDVNTGMDLWQQQCSL
jgi:hypothetical protein